MPVNFVFTQSIRTRSECPLSALRVRYSERPKAAVRSALVHKSHQEFIR